MCQYFRFNMKIMSQNISYKNTSYFLRYAHVRYEKSLSTNIQKRQNMLKISLLFKKFTKSRANNSRTLRIKNAKFSGYCFYMNTNVTEIFKSENVTEIFNSSHHISFNKCPQRLLNFETVRCGAY